MSLLPDFACRRRFAPLFGTQFLGAFNDNLFKTTLFVMITFYGLGSNGMLPAGQMLNLGALLFVLPYFIFSALAGQLATRFDKARLAQMTKLLEIAVMLLAAAGFFGQSVWLLLLCLFIMGAQSALFGPVKYAVLPEYLDDKELVMGNGLIESGTFVAILFGQIFGTLIAGQGMWLLALTVVAVAAAGWLCSLAMPPVSPREPQLRIDGNIVRSTKTLLAQTFARRDLATAVLGISWFWLVGAVYTTQLPVLVKQHLGGSDHVFNLMLALFSLGIAGGSVWCAKLSRGCLRLELVSRGAAGLAACGVLLGWLCYGRLPETGDLAGLGTFLAQWCAYPVMLLITAIGVCGGFFSVPLYTWLQTACDDTFRAQAVAANNIVNSLFMVGGALFSTVMLLLWDNTAVLYALVALGNVPVMVYLGRRERSLFRPH